MPGRHDRSEPVIKFTKSRKMPRRCLVFCGSRYSFPLNFVGTIRFKPLPSAASGSNLTVLLGEWLVATAPGPGSAPPPSAGPYTDYTYPKISGGQQQFENHVLRAGNANPLTTLFCWHGFQYVRVTPSGDTGFTGALDAIVGLAIHTNMTLRVVHRPLLCNGARACVCVCVCVCM